MSNGNLRNVSITIPDDVLAEFDLRAAALDLSRSQFMRMIIRRELARKDAAKDMTKANGGLENLPKPEPEVDPTQPELMEAHK